MEKEEFIKKMNEYNYTDEEIKDFVQLVEEYNAKGIKMKYEDIVLEKKEEDK